MFPALRSPGLRMSRCSGRPSPPPPSSRRTPPSQSFSSQKSSMPSRRLTGALIRSMMDQVPNQDKGRFSLVNIFQIWQVCLHGHPDQTGVPQGSRLKLRHADKHWLRIKIWWELNLFVIQYLKWLVKVLKNWQQQPLRKDKNVIFFTQNNWIYS